MRNTATCLLLTMLLMGSAWADANPDQPEYHAKLKDQVLYILLSQPQTYALPHLYIFDGSGTAIYHKVGFDRHLGKELDQAMKDGQSPTVPQPFPLSTFLGWVDFDAGSDTLQKLQSEQGVITFVEFWAPWCEACTMERRAIGSYLSGHPELKVRWLNVSADPDTMDPVLRKQAEQERQENIHKAKGGT
jgi:hypothetical protein